MKSLYFVAGFIFAFAFQLNAQTIKNIHRHNLPVLKIPIDLIDKVETIDLNGVKTLQISSLFGEITQVPVSEIDSVTHYTGSVNPEQLGVMRTASVMGIVRGPTGAAEMNAIVRSPYGGEETRTDPNGVFFLNDIVVYDKLGYITITKPGFHNASRSFLPLAQGSNRVNIQLLPMTQSGSFSSASGGQVNSGLLQLNFPANAIVLNGQPYTGTVSVYAKALDPSSPEMFDQMPGDLLGGMNDSLRLLRSFGMAAVELRDANMNELQLADGASATLTFNIPSALQADAPQTIDWWSFDEALGYWKHEGEAQKTGTQYIGAASHFSWWNVDVPENFNDFNGSINMAEGSPVADAQVNVVTPNLGTGITYTNAEGVFSGRVPINQNLTLNIKLTCSTTNDWNLVYTEDFSSATEPIVGQYEPESLEDRYPITGTVVNCEGQPVESGYVKMGSQVFIANQGEFTFQTCATGECSIRAFDTSNPDTIRASDVISVQVENNGAEAGSLQACLELYGTITDIDENVYTTVLIGDQWWMAENLKTVHFADGSEIPNVTDNTEWSELSTPAWCNYDNSEANDSINGKLYNWHTIAGGNVCPTDWHVPTDAEWTILTDYLGGLSVAGGKMKTTIGWQSPNTGATNESDFSGIPAGLRNYASLFSGIGAGCFWWTSTEFETVNAYYRYLNYNDSLVLRGLNFKLDGYPIRCVKD
ncbi:MAG: FISUMP domain-containing protein [Bacteroidia bacterium]